MTALPPSDEHALLARLSAGDADAFATLFGHYQEPLRGFVLQYAKSPELAEDLTQEIFLKIWEQREKLAALQSFRAFLFTVARNHTLNMLKTAARRQVAMGEIARHALASRDHTDDRVLLQEYGLFLRRVLDTLPPRSREVFRLCREQNLSYGEVARQLGISRNSVKNHMVLSMKILRTAVEKDLGLPLGLFLLLLYGR